MSGAVVLMSVSLGNLHSIFQSRGILGVIMTVNKNQGVVLVVLDDVHNTSKVLGKQNTGELAAVNVTTLLYTSHRLDFSSCSRLLGLSRSSAQKCPSSLTDCRVIGSVFSRPKPHGQLQLEYLL